jgi:diaminopimelate epimerase
MKFTKMQATGNDFILVEASEVNRDWSRMAIAMCDRHFGIGGDGLLVVSPSDKADLCMREFNLDGSEAEACGNGLRCVAKYAAYSGLVGVGAHQISVETIAGVRQAKLYRTGKKITSIQVSMGEPRFGAKDIPVLIEPSQGEAVGIMPILDYSLTVDGKELLLNIVSMGNPHAVCFWQHPVADFPLSQLGPEVERHRVFPNRINFEVANVINRQRIETRVWERGVGETLACGSGACAVTVAAQLHGYIGNKVDIKLPGGILNVEWDGVGEVLLSGSAKVVFTGEWPEEV